MESTGEITVVLQETETQFLFEMPSKTVEKGTEEGEAVEKDNENYDYLTIGKGKNRKTTSVETQTNEYILKRKFTMVPKIENEDSYAFASAWDMYDSFKQCERKEITTARIKSIEVIDECDDVDENLKILTDLSTNTNFINSALITERILAHNIFSRQQEDFKGISDIRDDDDSYMKYLWSFTCKEINNQAVTTMCWNPENNDILAVGYGKYHYKEKTKGGVAIWSVKNLVQPERFYHFDDPVTSMAFSNRHPNLLAIGFYNGDVLILSIIKNEKEILFKSNRKTCPSYEPIWQVTWYVNDTKEHVITAGQDGRINLFTCTKTKDFVCNQLIRLYRVDGNIKGDENVNNTQDIPILKYIMCMFLCRHPKLSDIYYVGSMDGFIYKCSMDHSDRYIDVFSAHDGPVYNMQFSHFRNNIFITCGADWTVKLWMENITDPLVILANASSPIKSALFCPTHSTVVAAIGNQSIYLWDLKQDNQILLSEVPMASKESILTCMKFTNNGKNMVVADTKGSVHVYNLQNIRIAENNENEILDNALEQILMKKPDLMKKVLQIRRLK